MHPALEAVITVDEEVGMEGASALDVTDLKADYLINIDNEEEKQQIEAELASLPKEGKEYAKARGMQNVLTQFEKIEIKKGEVV